MKIIKAICFIILLLLTSIGANSQPGTINAHTENSQLVRDLSGYQWKMKRMRPGQGVQEGLHELPPEDIETLVWNPARVPGDVYTDLWKAGVIDDPYFERNSAKAQWVMYEEWWYATQFNITEDLSDKVIRIDFEGVDYSCEVWLNGTYLGSHEGAFSPFSFDVTQALRSSKDRLASRNILIVKLNPPPQVNAKVAGRKTPWFGDYWRDLVPFGIWRPVKIVSTGQVRIDDLFVHSSIFVVSGAQPEYCRDVFGSYSPDLNLLNIVKYQFNHDSLYLNSLWGHDHPYRGDVINIFNGEVNDSLDRDWPFFEFESSSSAKALAVNEEMTHKQSIYHFEGDEEYLDEIAPEVLGVSLVRVRQVFIK